MNEYEGYLVKLTKPPVAVETSGGADGSSDAIVDFSRLCMSRDDLDDCFRSRAETEDQLMMGRIYLVTVEVMSELSI